MSNFSFFQPGTKSARSLDCRPVHDGGRMNENKENGGREGGGGTDKTLKEELFSTRACFLTPHERESRPGSERSLLLSVQ